MTETLALGGVNPIADPTAVVRCRGIVRSYGSVHAVAGMDLDVRDGELLALLGPSGCGKTTTLRLIAGFERLDAGTIELSGRPVSSTKTHVPPERRRVGVVFQDYALFPHLTVAQNVGFGLRDRSTRAARVAAMLDLVGLSDAAGRHPHQLSGGQQQRVALARALAPEPELVLLDEPFSNLDAALRLRMRSEVRRILRDAEATAVFVTHDQEEALSLADRVAVMRDGHLLQLASPAELYAEPADAFVATFVGDADLIRGAADGASVDTAIGTFPLASPTHGAVDVILRPEQIRLRLDGHGLGTVTEIQFFGHDQLIAAAFPDGIVVRARTGPRRVLEPGDRVSVAVTGDLITYPSDQGSLPFA